MMKIRGKIILTKIEEPKKDIDYIKDGDVIRILYALVHNRLKESTKDKILTIIEEDESYDDGFFD